MEYLFNKNEFNRTVRRKRYKKVYRTLYTSIPVFPYWFIRKDGDLLIEAGIPAVRLFFSSNLLFLHPQYRCAMLAAPWVIPAYEEFLRQWLQSFQLRY